MKKIPAVLFVMIMLSAFSIRVEAHLSADIYAEPVIAHAGQTVTIPLIISGNPGIMGYAITLHYDDSFLRPSSVTKGMAFSGMFNDSIETSSPGSFSVLWTGTTDVITDDLLFSATFSVNGSAKGGTSINLSYSQADTFNSSWQDVGLNLQRVEISISGHSYGEWFVDIEPTRTSSGLKHRVCSVCGSTEQQTIPALKGSGYHRLFEWAYSLPLVFQIPVWILVVPLALIVSPVWVFFV